MKKSAKFPDKVHPSQRGQFAATLYEEMAKDESIWLICADLGYKVFDYHFRDFPSRCINTGAAEQAAMGIAIGLALQGKKPYVYSITNFAIYRPFEWIRNYLDHEVIPVRIVCAGIDYDYEHDGWTHQCPDIKKVLSVFDGLTILSTSSEGEAGMSAIEGITKNSVKIDLPQVILLRR